MNTEKKLEEWNAEKKDRELEKIAEEYIKKSVKMAKKSGQGGDGGAEKYVEKYKKDSAKCMEEVDKSVRESLVNAFKGKRKSLVEEGEKSKSKKLKIWMGKRKVDESDSDEEDDDSDDAMGEETEKSVVINNENHSDSNKEADGSSASVNGGKLDGGSSVGCSSESGSEEEKETIPDGKLRSVQDSDSGSLNDEKDDPSKPVLEIHEGSIVQNKDTDVAAVYGNEAIRAELDQSNKIEAGTVEETICQASTVDSVQEAGVSTADIKPVVDVETVAASSDGPDLEKPLNFDDFSSATEMEVLGMERLKSGLQARGLKCGGTLQERAARLFLLKTTPLEKLPKKLLAKK